MEDLKACGESKKKKFKSTEVQSCMQAKKQLEDQYIMRSATQKSSYKPHFHEPINENSNTKPAVDLIKEIATLELEVMHLEKNLLSMYRETFKEMASSFPSLIEKRSKDLKMVPAYLDCDSAELAGDHLKNSSITKSVSLRLPQIVSDYNPSHKRSKVWGARPLLDSSIRRCHSSVSTQVAARSFGTNHPKPTATEAAKYSYKSLPLSMLEQRMQDSTSTLSLAEHLGIDISDDYVHESPNWLSEEMIKCISAIYCQLAEPPSFNHGFSFAPISLPSSMSDSPSKGQFNRRSLLSKGNSSFNSYLNNPFCVEGSKELSGSYFSTVEIRGICRDSWRMKGAEHMLQSFRSLVSQLEKVDPTNLKHEKKIAFWINVHNVLVMHTYLVYGVPQNNMKRTSLLLKAAYNIGGHIISIDMMEASILGCRLPRPKQWFQSLFSPQSKSEALPQKAYAIDGLQPLLYFALSTGSKSDPMVRIYTPKRLFHELEMAKEEYIQTACRIQKGHKICLPKIVDFYAKELSLCSTSLLQMIKHSTPYCIPKSFHQSHHEKLPKKIKWIPHNFSFRYLLAPELAKR